MQDIIIFKQHHKSQVSLESCIDNFLSSRDKKWIVFCDFDSPLKFQSFYFNLQDIFD
jgi:hypothetical protein